MRKTRILVYLAAAAVTVLGIWSLQSQDPIENYPTPKAGPFPEVQLPEGKLAIEGTVLDPQGKGIGDSWVTALGIKKIASARCDEQGHFRIEGLNAGFFEITAAARGYRPASATIKSGEGPVRLGLQPLGHFGEGPDPPPSPSERYTLTCRLQREGGTFAGFSVALVPQDVRIASGIRRADADASGIFQIDSIYPGSYTLRVLATSRAQDLDFCFAIVPIEFGPEKKLPDQIVFGTRKIEGSVLIPPIPDLLPPPPDWSTLQGAAVKLSLLLPGGERVLAGFADSDAQGRFSFSNLPQGEYVIDVLASDFERLQQKIERDAGALVELKLPLVRKRP